MNLFLRIQVVGFLLLLIGSVSGQPKIKITSCSFPVTDESKRQHSDFSIAFAFRVDRVGSPIKISKVLGKNVEQISEVHGRQCISGWRLVGFKEKSLFVAQFFWKHGLGWSKLTINGAGFDQEIDLPLVISEDP